MSLGLLWTRGVAARVTLGYLDRRGIDAEPALFGAGSQGPVMPHFIALLAKTCELTERIEEAVNLLDETLHITKRTGER